MNIYADRGNILFLRRRCEWRGIGFEHATAGPGEGFDPGAHDLIYIGGGQDRDQELVAEDMVAHQARGARRRRRRRRGGARRLRRLPAARPRLRARRAADRRARAGRPRDRARAGRAADRQRRDRGRPRRRAGGSRSPGSRTTAGAPTSAPGSSRSAGCSAATATTATTASRASVARNLFGTYLHGPLLPKNALARRPSDRAGARPRRPAGESRSSSRSTTSSRRRPTPAPGPPRCATRAGLASGRAAPTGGLQRPVEPNPPSPRAVALSSATSTGTTPATATITSWAIRSPGSISNGAPRSVFSSRTRSSPR